MQSTSRWEAGPPAFDRNCTPPQDRADLEDGLDIDENDAGHLTAR